MRDNDGSDDDYDLNAQQPRAEYGTDLFGRYSVVGPGVHIVLDGKPVTRGSEAI